MIKFFQKLKAKKGFTLVELIVVIAIIGVLAAILVPTMLGYVTSSRVTSADSTAASIKNNIDTFLTNCDTAGYGMKLSDSAKASLLIEVSGGEWTVTLGAGADFDSEGSTDGAGAFKTKEDIGSWEDGAADATVKDGTKVKAKDDCRLMLAYELKNLFPEIKSAVIHAYLQGGKALYVWYTADGSADDEITGTLPVIKDFEDSKCAWDGNTAGVSDEGYIIGTAPKLALGESNGDAA